MKIVCDNCATKYSIADEKVRGKVFKIRCKKCSHIIVVRGNEDGSAAPSADAGGFDDDGATRLASPGEAPAVPVGTGDEGVWHLVIGGEQVGPFTPEEVRSKVASGEVDVETYAWKDGFSDWMRLGSIEEFSDLEQAAAADESGRTRRAAPEHQFPQNNDDSGGGELFAAAKPPAEFSGGLFGAPSGGMGMSGQAEPKEPRLAGQRNENSVLFSLNNLQSLSSGPASSGKSSPAPEHRPGYASAATEGSGLIDIRAMAAQTLSAAPAQSKPDDFPGISAAPVFSPMAAPILMPAQPTGMPKWFWLVIAMAGFSLVAIVVVGAIALTRKSPDDAPKAALPTTPPPGAAAAAAPAAAPAGAAAAAAPAAAPAGAPAGTPAAAAPAAAPAAPVAAAAPAHKDKDKSGRHESRGSKKEPAMPAGVVAPPSENTPPPKAASGKKKDALDDLLDSASPEKEKPAAKHESASSGDSDLPDQLGKGEIMSGMSRVSSRVSACRDEYNVSGQATIAVTIGKSGRVSSAKVKGQFAGTPTGSCVEKAVKSASFPPFKGSPITFDYPYNLR